MVHGWARLNGGLVSLDLRLCPLSAGQKSAAGSEKKTVETEDRQKSDISTDPAHF